MMKTVISGRFLRNAGTGFASLCFAGLLAMGAGCLPAASNDTGSNGGNSGNNSSSSSGGGGGSSSSSNSGGSSSSSSSSSSSGGGGSSSSSSSSNKAGSGGSSSSSSSSSGGGGSSSSSSSSSSASGGGGSSSSTTPTGGSTGTGPTGTTVTFANGKAVGAMTGYGWVAFGSAATVTSPTCGTEKITAGCASTTWSTKDSLCMTASIPALDAAKPDYTANWGVQIGVDSTDAKGGLGQSLSSVTIAISGSPTSGLRAKVHLKGDAEGTDYCAAYTTGAISFTSFTKTCYDTASPGTAITAADVSKIDQIGIQVPSGSAAISVSNLCITGITFK